VPPLSTHTDLASFAPLPLTPRPPPPPPPPAAPEDGGPEPPLLASAGASGASAAPSSPARCAPEPPPVAFDATPASGGGLNRSAAFGTASTSFLSAKVTVALAVMPGRSRPSVLLTAITAS